MLLWRLLTACLAERGKGPGAVCCFRTGACLCLSLMLIAGVNYWHFSQRLSSLEAQLLRLMLVWMALCSQPTAMSGTLPFRRSAVFFQGLPEALLITRLPTRRAGLRVLLLPVALPCFLQVVVAARFPALPAFPLLLRLPLLLRPLPLLLLRLFRLPLLILRLLSLRLRLRLLLLRFQLPLRFLRLLLLRFQLPLRFLRLLLPRFQLPLRFLRLLLPRFQLPLIPLPLPPLRLLASLWMLC